MKARLVAYETENDNDRDVRSVLDIIEVELTDDRKRDWKRFSAFMKELFFKYGDDPAIHVEIHFGEPD